MYARINYKIIMYTVYIIYNIYNTIMSTPRTETPVALYIGIIAARGTPYCKKKIADRMPIIYLFCFLFCFFHFQNVFELRNHILRRPNTTPEERLSA